MFSIEKLPPAPSDRVFWKSRETCCCAGEGAWPIAFGPCTARLVQVFKLDFDLDRAQEIAQTLLPLLDAELAHKPFAAGNHVTIADIAAHTYIAHAPEGGVSLEPYAHLRAWLERVAALPGFVPMPSTKAGLLAA